MYQDYLTAISSQCANIYKSFKRSKENPSAALNEFDDLLSDDDVENAFKGFEMDLKRVNMLVNETRAKKNNDETS